MKKQVDIYTDGCCLGNPGPGGWAFVVVGVEEQGAGCQDTTNNRMELTAAIKALEYAQVGVPIRLYTDSQYVRKGITEWLKGWKARGWKKSDHKPVMNQDLWQELDRVCQRHGHGIEWHWVKAHNQNPYNEQADALAKRYAQALQSGCPLC